jgi:hypothetical protein
MKKVFPDLPGWSFDLEEVSAGVYEVVGSDQLGRVVSAKGTDLDEITIKCREKARKFLR